MPYYFVMDGVKQEIDEDVFDHMMQNLQELKWLTPTATTNNKQTRWNTDGTHPETFRPQLLQQIRRPESACTSNNLMQNPNRSQNPKSKIRNPKSKIQNPKSKIQNQKSKIQNPRSKIQNPKSKIQNPKSKRPRLGLPQKERIPRQSKIQNPKSKIRNPKSKIQNPRSKIQNPKSQIQNPKSKIQNPKSKIQTPKSKIQNLNGLDFGFWILEFGFGWPGWGGYAANALVWMGWPPKFGVVGRGPSL